MTRKRNRRRASGTHPSRLRARRKTFATVLRDLREVGQSRHDVDSLVEKLRKCPDTFIVGELLGKIFDELKYNNLQETGSEERLIPPAGSIVPLT